MEKMASRAGRLKEKGDGERHGTRRLKERGAVKDTLPLNLAS